MDVSLISHSSETELALNEILTQYVYSSHKIYKSLQSLHHTKSEEKQSGLIRKCSVSFRQSVNEFVRMLSAYAEELDYRGTSGVEIVDDVIDVINDAQKLWHIAEFFVLSPSHTVSLDTILWLQVTERPTLLTYI